MSGNSIGNPSVAIACLDVSNEDLVQKVCRYIDSGMRVQIMSIEKSSESVQSQYTFMGKQLEQERPGITISSYKARVGDCLLQID